MVNKILFWSGFGKEETQSFPSKKFTFNSEIANERHCLLGLAVRFWQLGIEMRPFHHQLWAYGIYGGLGASFGYWMQSVEQKQMRYLRETRDRLLEKRRRRAEREGALDPGVPASNTEGIGLREVSGEDIAVAEGRKLAGRA